MEHHPRLVGKHFKNMHFMNLTMHIFKMFTTTVCFMFLIKLLVY